MSLHRRLPRPAPIRCRSSRVCSSETGRPGRGPPPWPVPSGGPPAGGCYPPPRRFVGLRGPVTRTWRRAMCASSRGRKTRLSSRRWIVGGAARVSPIAPSRWLLNRADRPTRTGFAGVADRGCQMAVRRRTTDFPVDQVRQGLSRGEPGADGEAGSGPRPERGPTPRASTRALRHVIGSHARVAEATPPGRSHGPFGDRRHPHADASGCHRPRSPAQVRSAAPTSGGASTRGPRESTDRLVRRLLDPDVLILPVQYAHGEVVVLTRGLKLDAEGSGGRSGIPSHHGRRAEADDPAF